MATLTGSTDPDGEAVTYTLESGGDYFILEGNVLSVKTLNFETLPVTPYAVTGDVNGTLVVAGLGAPGTVGGISGSAMPKSLMWAPGPGGSLVRTRTRPRLSRQGSPGWVQRWTSTSTEPPTGAETTRPWMAT